MKHQLVLLPEVIEELKTTSVVTGVTVPTIEVHGDRWHVNGRDIVTLGMNNTLESAFLHAGNLLVRGDVPSRLWRQHRENETHEERVAFMERNERLKRLMSEAYWRDRYDVDPNDLEVVEHITSGVAKELQG